MYCLCILNCLHLKLFFQVLGIQEYVIKPLSADINANFLSDEVQVETRLTEAAIRTSGVTLSKALSLVSLLFI